ncbi:DUF2459 domain-containing protein [Alteraurantiacibacter aquimixticola]|uniref:DUF2459 domain-containing protein n=1 Tax=Alteraurantiacibacter aquimixticola TaxID=2489173 RepID=A0A4T3F115_9SPHN|nr:DUF2459 domain-containing protein [Alteraurantiacibacter aquimixticola]
MLGAALLLLAIIVVYPLTGWLGSAIPRNDPTPVIAEGVTIMVETNGTHTGVIMPIVTSEKDWRETFPSAGQPTGRGMPTHVAVGWGEREVFLNVPTWGDLKPGTALRIAVFGGEPIMRVSHYVRPAPGLDHRPVTISREAYLTMVLAIEDSLPPADGPRTILRGTSPADAYYDANGTYTLAYTCNSWVGDILAEADIQMGLWTPFSGGVMKWIEPPAVP